MEKLYLTIMVGCGGFIGASLRYVLSAQCGKIFGGDFPYGTLLVNIIGAFLIGVFMELSLSTTIISPNIRLFLTTGMMGGLTTFSTFSFETMELIMNGSSLLGILNIILNLFLSLIFVIIGQSIIRFML